MKSWMFSPAHFESPYPNEAEKRQMADAAGISLRQLCNWFTNARKRLWQPLLRQRGDNVERFLNTARNRGQGRRSCDGGGGGGGGSGADDDDEGEGSHEHGTGRLPDPASRGDVAGSQLALSAPRGAALTHALANKRSGAAYGGRLLWGGNPGHSAPQPQGGFGLGAATRWRPEMELRACEGLLQLLVQSS